MGTVKRITSRDNPFYKSLLRLASSARVRREAGQTLLDGPHLLRAWLESGQHPLHLVVNDSALHDAEISELLARCADIPTTVLDALLFKQLSELKTPNGLLALIGIPPAEIAGGNFILLLEDIQDPGNLGSILRSAAAAGCDAVYLSQGCADAWSPKVLRAGMGGHCVLNIHEDADLIRVAETFSGSILAASLQAEHSLYACDLRGAIGFAIGNEGAGLSPGLQEKVRQRFIIPMPGKVESLNAAAAAAVCLFEAVRCRS
ncbi:MAG: RNA methyltransferase [Gallionella sp.]|nr:RNA methyltransferase [Gallionella sp.]PIR09256.1 MAG: rRNA methyltransferase [Gallionellaceae bacterium CG11_big_fil_rev_8_21_14_0_20_60_62]PIV47885.1 MAG: RNA methyltransferase [Gallionellaceae bacterium CG02_land_8_20_14_3_00_60_115]PJC04893.1 MAG: RNA methyltransferase [Gallionellaceae bacterium CG_4_9_14_0_8_um_filter_60_335]